MIWLRLGSQIAWQNKFVVFAIIALVYAIYMRLPFMVGAWTFVQWSLSMKLKVATANGLSFLVYSSTVCLFPNDFQASYASIIAIISGLAGMLLMYLPPVHETFSIGFHVKQSEHATRVMLLLMGRGLIVTGLIIMVIGNAIPDVLTPLAWGLISLVFIGGPVYGQHLDRRKSK